MTPVKLTSASKAEDHWNRAGDPRTAFYPHHLYALGGVLRAGTTQCSSQRKQVGDNESTGCPRNPWHPPIPRAASHLLFSTPSSILTSHPLCPDTHPSLPHLFRSHPWHPIVLVTSSTHVHVHVSPSLTSSFQSILIQAAWGGGRSSPLCALSPLSAFMNCDALRGPTPGL